MENNKKKWHSYLLNKYVVVGVIFIIYMAFFDQNSYLMHYELNNDIQKLKEDVSYYQKELKKQTEQLKQLNNNKDYYERIAREKYFMKKPNEDIFIIEAKDSVQERK